MTPRQHRKQLGLSRPPSLSSPRAGNLGNDKFTSSETSLDREEAFWMDVLKLLSEAPRDKPKKANREEVYLSLDTLIDVSGVQYSNAWIEQFRDGCEVDVQDHNQEFRGKRLVYLSGTQRAIELTKERLLKAERHRHPSVSSLSREDIPADNTPTPKGYSRSRTPPSQRNTRGEQPQVDLITEPTEWNIRTFADYVEDLVASTASSHMNRAISRSGWINELPRLPRLGDPSDQPRHFEVVAARLAELFTRKELRHCISFRAQNHALGFLLRHYQIRPGPSFNLINSMLSHEGIDMRPRMFNEILVKTLEERNTRLVKSLFKFGQEKNIPVTAQTGLAVLARTNSAKVKLAVCQWLMDNKFTEDSSIMRRLCAQLLPQLSISFLRKGNGVKSFCALLDKSVGPVWFNKAICFHMLQAWASNRLQREAEEFLTILQKRKMRLSPEFVDSMILLYYRCGKIEDIVALLKTDWARTTGRNDRYAIPFAFMAAWKAGYYNTCRVLWHYASLKGVLTYTMKQVVFWTLIRNSFREGSKRAPDDEAKRNWLLTAGKVIAGVGLETESLWKPYPGLQRDCLQRNGDENPMKSLVKADNIHRQDQKELLNDIMKNDEQAFMHLQPDFKLSELLNEAYQLDLNWVETKSPGKGVFWMIDNAITVPLKPRDQPLSSPKSLDLSRADMIIEENDENAVSLFRPIPIAGKIVAHD
ncbi:hypothetical protein UCRPC4_g05060 [Phaeomoniella chlamydospora]|uniref:Pentatricopeptide repeat protein n=1 Tax=Phaeomoniella chlamydospora TaxID=158046 RepID=A0A0G2GMT6_PHACM|nr:hypothetical protein UCRPC4_g05060 [Phaeomoniella chlamydospora]